MDRHNQVHAGKGGNRNTVHNGPVDKQVPAVFDRNKQSGEGATGAQGHHQVAFSEDDSFAGCEIGS
jgi:uncharacterized sporulation protein YeaH/YhbH (DUF444 family)